MSLSIALLKGAGSDQGAATASLQQSPTLERAVPPGTFFGPVVVQISSAVVVQISSAGDKFVGVPGGLCAQGPQGERCDVFLRLGPAVVGVNPA